MQIPAALSYSVQSETQIKISLKDNMHTLYGVLRGSWSQPLIIIVHGLTGNSEETLYFLAAKYFTEQGFATFRINLYGDEDDARNAFECDIDVHAQDLDTVVEFVQAQGSQIVFVIGHSYGGLTILRSQSQVNGAILWDPSRFDSRKKFKLEANEQKFIEHDVIINKKGQGYIVPLSFIRKQQELGDSFIWSRKDYPLHIIAAGNGELLESSQNYFDNAHEPKKLTIIDNAGHDFLDSDKVLLTLLETTNNWLHTLTTKH